MMCLRTSVWKVSTDRWMMLLPLLSVFLQLAPSENRYLMVSSAPDVAASSSGVHWFLRPGDAGGGGAHGKPRPLPVRLARRPWRGPA